MFQRFKTRKIGRTNYTNKGSKNTCKDLGFKEGTEKFAECGLKLYTKNIDKISEKKRCSNSTISPNNINFQHDDHLRSCKGF